MAKQLLFENSVSLYDILFENIKIRASIGMQLRLDLILFIVQLGAAGPPKYTFTMQSYIYILNKEDALTNFSSFLLSMP